MTLMTNGLSSRPDLERASHNFARLMEYIANLYCAEGASSISAREAHGLTMSACYALGISNASADEAARVLTAGDPVESWKAGIAKLDKRADSALSVWRDIVAIMPPINNVSLRDTLASLGDLKRLYNVYFAAHEVPCDIDYQLSKPINPHLMGIGYIEAWLDQLSIETRWIAQFEVGSCIDVLERACPDYRGLHINLYELLLPHKDGLVLLDEMR